MRRQSFALLVSLLVSSTGCLHPIAPKSDADPDRDGMLGSPPTPEQKERRRRKCETLLERQHLYGALGGSLAVAGGAGGLGAINVENNSAQLAISVGGILVGVASAFFVQRSAGSASEFVQLDCADSLTKSDGFN